MRDLASNISPTVLIGAATLAANNTPVAVDLQGFESCAILIDVGIGGITFSGTNKIEFVLEHSDDGSTWTQCVTADVQGVTIASGGIVLAFTAAKPAASVTEVGYVGNKRYVRLTASFSGTHGTGTPMSAAAVRGHPIIKATA